MIMGDEIRRDIELFVAGWVISAAAETEYDIFTQIWNHDLASTWERAARAQGWAFQQFGWGNPC